MRGPVAELVKAGGGGRHRNNVRRDWFRQMGRMDRDHRASWCLNNFELGSISPCTISHQLAPCESHRFHPPKQILSLSNLRHLSHGWMSQSWSMVIRGGNVFKSALLISIIFVAVSHQDQTKTLYILKGTWKLNHLQADALQFTT